MIYGALQMEILRTIGDANILVEPSNSHGLYFDEKFLTKNAINKVELSQLDICRLLSKDHFRPIFLHWEIIDKCSFSCPFCYIVGHSNNSVVRFYEIKNNLNYLIQCGLLYCIISGGEATVHPDFIEIYTHLKKSGVIVEVYSNAAFLSEDTIAILKRYPPHKFEVSIYALDLDAFKINTQSNFTPNDVLNNVLNLKNSGINVICKTPVNRFTMKQIERIREWCILNSITHYHSTDVFDAYDRTDLSENSAPLDIKTQFDAQNELAFRESHGIPSSSGSKIAFSCSVGAYGVHINSAFHLYPCSSFNGKIAGYDIKEMGMKDALSKLRNFIDRTKGTLIDGCVGCEASVFCKTCPATTQEILDNETVIGYKTNSNRCATIQHEYKLVSSRNAPRI